MTSIQVAYQELVTQLIARVGEGEAHATARLFFEDLFDWHRGRRDRALTEKEVDLLAKAQQRLLSGEPVQYVTGQADFYGLRLNVSPVVLIPRPETEELVEWVLEAKERFNTPKILDIGTGSGCIPLAIKHQWPTAEVWGVDLSPAALEVARENAKTLELDVNWQQLDILDREAWKKLPVFDIIISNPPYIPHHEATLMPEDVITHEPHLALFVENDDPLVFYRTILQFARQQAAPASIVFFECNEFNAEEVAKLGEVSRFQNGELRRDMQAKWRMWRGAFRTI